MLAFIAFGSFSSFFFSLRVGGWESGGCVCVLNVKKECKMIGLMQGANPLPPLNNEPTQHMQAPTGSLRKQHLPLLPSPFFSPFDMYSYTYLVTGWPPLSAGLFTAKVALVDLTSCCSTTVSPGAAVRLKKSLSSFNLEA